MSALVPDEIVAEVADSTYAALLEYRRADLADLVAFGEHAGGLSWELAPLESVSDADFAIMVKAVDVALIAWQR